MFELPKLNDAEIHTLFQANDKGMLCEIQGVLFDLNHIDLDRQVWKREGKIIGMGARFGPPWLFFPWNQDENYGLKEGALKVLPGDSICIASVDRIKLAHPWGKQAYDDDVDRLDVNLVIKRADGTNCLVSGPLRFAPKGKVWASTEKRNWNSAYAGLKERLRQILKIDLSENWLRASDADYLRSNLAALSPEHQTLALAFKALWDMHHPDEFTDPFAVASMFGYLMARAEAEQRMLARALNADGISGEQSLAGQKTGKQKADRADALYKNDLLVTCKEARKKDPQLGQKKLARLATETSWYIALGGLAPDENTMVQAIKQFERKDRLPRGERNPSQKG